jgi:hypothetical protein
VTVRKREEARFEQAELFGREGLLPARPEAALKVVGVVDMAAEPVVGRDVVEAMPVCAVVEAAQPVRPKVSGSTGVKPVTATVRRGPPMVHFLNVTGALEGVKPVGTRFELPGRRLVQSLRLWSGTMEGSSAVSAPR